MKILKNKFISFIFLGILGLFIAQFYFVSNSFQRDTNSYVTLLQGQGKIFREQTNIFLKKEEKSQILPGDEITTIGEDALAVIEWGDKSITRLAGNSKIKVQENFVSQDLGNIQISFELLRGRTWSNVISLLGEKNYFKQQVQDNVAAVRGTVYEANFDDSFVFVHNHEVKITSPDGSELSITSGQAVSLKDFNIIENVKAIRDAAWEKINNELDVQYLQELRENFLQSFQNTNPFNFISKFSEESKVLSYLEKSDSQGLLNYISSLPEEKQEKMYNILETINQTIHFENGENTGLYAMKNTLREVLIEKTQDTQLKELYLRYTMYDIQTMLSQNIDVSSLQDGLDLLKKYKIDLNSPRFEFLYGMKFEDFEKIFLNSQPQDILEMLQSGKSFLDNAGQNLMQKFISLPK